VSTHELILTVLREKLNPDTHSALLALSDEEFRKVLFLNFRTQHGQARGMKLTHIGYALMSECFKSFVIEIEESKKARITNIHWVVLDRECNLPYYYNDNKKRIQTLNYYNQVAQEKARLINETEELYISEKITKREYEVLMKKINKM
jgi:hypothetical protein